MKKALSMILVMTMVLALALPAMAADGDPITTAPTESSKDVTASYAAPSHEADKAEVLYFTITWTSTAVTGDNALAYTGEQATYHWDGENMKYTKNTDGHVNAGWNDGTAGYTITVSNQSNIALKVVNTATTNFGLDLKQKVKNQDDTDFGTEQAYPTDGTTTTLASAATNAKLDGSTNGTAQNVSILYTFAKGENSTDPESRDVLTDGKTVTVGTLKVVVSKATGNA